MRTQFDNQLERLHVELIAMGGLCEEAISLAAKSLDKKEYAFIRRIAELEEEIDREEREIENLCMKLLLKQQPVARDLRTISAAMKMISDMERIGDQAADIAELSEYIADSQCASKVHIKDMAEAAVKMVTDSVEAFVKTDIDMAKGVIKTDDKVDMLFAQIKEELMKLISDKDIDAKASMDLLMAAKYFERIGDHAVNIAEWVEYSITGIHKNYGHGDENVL